MILTDSRPCHASIDNYLLLGAQGPLLNIRVSIGSILGIEIGASGPATVFQKSTHHLHMKFLRQLGEERELSWWANVRSDGLELALRLANSIDIILDQNVG